MLSFVGLGLYDQRSITLRGQEVLRSAETAFLERYTSTLAGTSLEELETVHEVTITECERADIERDPEQILSAATDDHAAVLVGGDPMVSTTHVDLRLRAHEREIPTQVVHGTTAQTAASSLSGLQNYRFGKATTLPFPETHGGVPESVTETIATNRERGLHTLVYLDIDGADRRYLQGDRAAGLLAGHLEGPGVVVARAGSEEPLVRADTLGALAEGSFGAPLHLLVVPGELHRMEREALVAFGDAPETLFE